MPKDPLEKLVDRPKRRPMFKPRTPAWVVMEPNRIGMAGGAIAGTAALIFYFLRHISGHPMTPQNVLVGAFATFVVGYGAFGVFTWYLLWVAERELPIPEEEYRIIGLPGRNTAAGSEGSPDTVAPETIAPTPSGEEL